MNIRQTLCIVLFILLSSPIAYGQHQVSELKPEAYFDFWLGTWDLEWKNKNGSIAKGTNTIERILDGNVIKENFEAVSGDLKGYVGKSYSVYNPDTGKWKQTWVDSQGAYLDFVGSVKGNKRIFNRAKVTAQGDTVWQRMVFYDITEDSFLWNWEQSKDSGKNWQILWKIAYRRH